MTTTTIDVYLECKQTLLEKIQAYDTLISAMETRATEIAAGLNVSVDEYSLDDGQMKVRTKYRNIDDLINGIRALEKMRIMYINRYNGRSFVLRDVRGLR